MGTEDLLTPEETPANTAASSSTPRWLIAAFIVFALALAGVAYSQYESNQTLSTQMQGAVAGLKNLEERAATLEADSADLRTDLGTATQKLGLTQKQLEQARAQARKLQEAQKQAASELAAHQQQLGSISSDVGLVRDDVTQTKQGLEATRSELERAVGDLGQQSGLIARNQQELDELKRRGEREYFDLNLQKSKQYAHVGSVSVRLEKVDTKRNKYTMTLLVNDRQIQKKDKTLLEPVQFYLPGTRHLLEIVVFEVQKDRVTGYLSAPKEMTDTRASG